MSNIVSYKIMKNKYLPEGKIFASDAEKAHAIVRSREERKESDIRTELTRNRVGSCIVRHEQ